MLEAQFHQMHEELQHHPVVGQLPLDQVGDLLLHQAEVLQHHLAEDHPVVA